VQPGQDTNHLPWRFGRGGRGAALISPRPNPKLRDRLRGLSSRRFGKETSLRGHLRGTEQYG